MNIFIAIGKINDVCENGRALKFTLAVHQGKPCYVPCLVIDPIEGIKEYLEDLQKTEQTVWLQGRITSSEFESKGRTIRKVDVIAYAKSIKII